VIRASIVLTLLTASGCALACSCEPSSESEAERLERSFHAATTVAVMRVIGFETSGSGEESSVVTQLQIEHLFKQSESSYPPYLGNGAYDRDFEGQQVISSCDIELHEGALIVAFADDRGLVQMGGCSPASGPVDFDTLPLLYKLKDGKSSAVADGT
jgi:hypothetical protein